MKNLNNKTHKIGFATKNINKIKEVKAILAPFGFDIITLLDIDFPGDIEEIGKSYKENAIIKAKAMAKLINIPVISDDTGLEIKALNNFPGIYSNRWKKEMSFQKAMAEIIKKMSNCRNRKAKMITKIVYYDANKNFIKTFTGKIKGRIAKEIPNKFDGFGYDQFFLISKQNKTLFDIGAIEKNKISHRSKALKKLLKFLMINFIE